MLFTSSIRNIRQPLLQRVFLGFSNVRASMYTIQWPFEERTRYFSYDDHEMGPSIRARNRQATFLKLTLDEIAFQYHSD
jgi:hypothetical protein